MIRDMTWAAIATFLILVALTVLVEVATRTGPNCPGMDPSWLGFCEAGQ